SARRRDQRPHLPSRREARPAQAQAGGGRLMARPLAPMAAIVLAALCAGCGGRDVRTPAGDDEPVTFRERAESALERGDRDGFVRVVEAEIDTLEAWARAFERDLATTDRSAPPQVRAAFRRFRDDLQKALAEARELR